VRAGDTACEIAEQYELPCRILFKANNLGAKGKIFRGQRLKIPGKSKSQVTFKKVESTSKWAIKSHSDSASDRLNFQPRYFFTHENFYVITRYNQSVLYAMAVHDLSVAIASARLHTQTLTTH
jgi:membrane-bound lytic murein transglycosylase B